MKNQDSKFTELQRAVGSRKSYLMGLALGVLLISINLTVGYLIFDLLTREPEIVLDSNISLPQIHFDDYEIVRDDFQSRIERDFITPNPNDPFDTGEKIVEEEENRQV